MISVFFFHLTRHFPIRKQKKQKYVNIHLDQALARIPGAEEGVRVVFLSSGVDIWIVDGRGEWW